MTDTLTKTENLNNFAGYDDAVEGDDEQSQGRVIQGSCIRFTNEATWVTRDGEELPTNLELVVVDIARVVQKWQDHQPVKTIPVPPGEKFPNVEKMNEETPREEWAEGPDGQLRGPWQAQSVAYMLNETTMDRYSFPTGTIGGGIAIHDLVDRTTMQRRMRGNNAIYPVVTLSDMHMNTRFGGRQRPHFNIVRWASFGAAQQVLPAPQSPALAPPDKCTANTASSPTQPQKVEPTQSQTVAAAKPRKVATTRPQTAEPSSKDAEFDDELPPL